MTALVTGSTAGIGLAIAEQLAAEGATAVLCGRNREKLDAAAIRVGRVGLVRTVLADPATADGAATLFDAVPDVDILINNLGIYEAKPFAKISDEDWHHIFEVNVVSGARLARYYFPRMIERSFGRVIFVASEKRVDCTSRNDPLRRDEMRAVGSGARACRKYPRDGRNS